MLLPTQGTRYPICNVGSSEITFAPTAEQLNEIGEKGRPFACKEYKAEKQNHCNKESKLRMSEISKRRTDNESINILCILLV
ncbi:hypothetical protein PG988_003649 [Apiospora saccharicola]